MSEMFEEFLFHLLPPRKFCLPPFQETNLVCVLVKLEKSYKVLKMRILDAKFLMTLLKFVISARAWSLPPRRIM